MIDMDSMEKKSLESLISCVTYLVLKYTPHKYPCGPDPGGSSHSAQRWTGPQDPTAHEAGALW